MTRLSAVAAVESGCGFPIADQGVSGAEFPFLKVSDMNLPGNEIEIRCWNNSVSDVVRQRLRAKAFPAGTVIFPKVGAAIATNKKRLLTRSCSIDNNCMGVTGDPTRVDPWFLFYLFRAKDLSDFASDSNPPSIRKTEVEAWDVTLPSLNEQHRVVDLLSRAENIVRMRREAEAKAKEIIPALFLDMFGDPGTNPKGWKVRRFGDLVERLEGGKNVQSGASGDSPFRILKISAVTSGTYDESEAKPAPTGFDPPEHYFVRDGDILFSRANTEALVGATAMVNTTEGNALLPDKLWRLMWRPAKGLAPTYMLALLQNRSVRKELSKIASGTGGSMKNISQAKLLELHLPIAPVSLQRAFENRLATVRSVLNGTRRAGGLAEQAFQSLLAGVFGDGTAVKTGAP